MKTALIGSSLVDIIFSGVSEIVDYQCRLAFDAMDASDQYLRVEVALERLPSGTTSDLDNAEPENLKGLCELGAETAEGILDSFVGEVLILVHQLR